MSWNQIVGHQTQQDLLRGTIVRQRLAHTYLFVGTEGIGKRTFARKLAQCLLCQTYTEDEFEACGTCPGCKQVLAGTHPDLFVVGCPEGKREIPVDTFIGPAEKRGKSGLCYDLSHTPMAGRRKIALINDAERLNEEGSNALLKTLEEPPPHSLIILIATHGDSILPTIRSRCQVIRFNPLLPAQIVELLLQQGLAADPDIAAIAAAACEGSLTQAAQLLNGELQARRNGLFDLLAAPNFNSLAVTGFVMDGVEAAGTETSAQREQATWYFRFCADFFLTAVNELITQQAGAIPQITQFRQRIRRPTADHLTGLANIVERIVAASQHVDQNVGVTLAVETLFDDLGRMLRALPAT